ncbi:MAG: chromosome segregation protein SMC, partial [Defluviitaleaceae bacterium]|nr:chromosome segregation protein SMC [Defluviitaleaceae bacterium]
AVLETENAYRRLEDDKEKLITETATNDDKLNKQTAAHAQCESAFFACEKELAAAKITQNEYDEIYSTIRRNSDELDEEIKITSESLTAARGQFRAISNLEAQREGYHRSVKSVLEQKFDGICGAVGELIGVEREFETAIETALGGAAQNIITQNEEHAKIAIEFLKNTKSGRATFLPLSAVKGKKIDARDLKNDAGFIGIAADLATCDEIFAPVIAFLLGDVVVVDDLENALAIHKKYDYSHKIVTKSGERLSPGGAITGGSTTRQNAGIIGRARQLELLKNEVDALQKKFDVLTVKQVALGEKRAKTRESITFVREKINSQQIEQQSLRKKLIDAEEIIEILRQNALNFSDENEKLMSQLASTNAAIRTAKAELTQNELFFENARANLENYQKEIEQNRREHTEEADVITELRVEISRREDRILHATQNITRFEKEIITHKEEIQKILGEISSNDSAIKNLRKSAELNATELERIQINLQSARDELTQSEQEKNSFEDEISKIEAAEREKIDAISLMEREIARLEAKKENLDTSSHRLHNEIWEEYGLTLHTAHNFRLDDLKNLHKRGQQLKFELSQMQNVNIGANESYKSIRERHEFLSAQRDDILGAEAELFELISKLTAQMETQFAEKFEEIAAHFQIVFKEMFEGGKAGLRLLDKENLLESGIEIIAQPPGKSLQNLMLLSGGERALTAIALLFAILRMKPSPFCVLDEIESALDDANVTRFANYLKLYAKGTQFIIITHRKGTMEAADNLYGVTMEEKGISKLVSVTLV